MLVLPAWLALVAFADSTALSTMVIVVGVLVVADDGRGSQLPDGFDDGERLIRLDSNLNDELNPNSDDGFGEVRGTVAMTRSVRLTEPTVDSAGPTAEQSDVEPVREVSTTTSRD